MERSSRGPRGLSRSIAHARRSRSGFTLIELMVVLAIIGIAMAASMPSMMQAMRDRRTQQAAIALINDFKEARSRATMRGRAHVLRVAIAGGFARAEIIEGDSNSCRLSNWSVPPARVIYIEREWGDPLTMVTEVSFAAQMPALGTMEYCFTPLGRMFYRLGGAGPFFDDATGVGGALNGGFMYTVSNTVEPATQRRRVFVPISGIARLAP